MKLKLSSKANKESCAGDIKPLRFSSESFGGKEKIQWMLDRNPAGGFHAIFIGGNLKNRPSTTERENRKKPRGCFQ